MKRNVLFLFLIISISFLSFFSVNFQNNTTSTPLKSRNLQTNLVDLFITKKILKYSEKTTLTIQLTNSYNKATVFTYSISGKNFFFTTQNGDSYQNASSSVLLTSNQKKNISILLWYRIDGLNISSSVQTINVEIIEARSSNTIHSSTEWIWLYNEPEELVKPRIFSEIFPLYTDGSVLVSFLIFFNETSSSGYIRFFIDNLSIQTQEYNIRLTNKSNYLHFEDRFIDSGYSCSLICSDKGFFNAKFQYNLPEDSIWVITPIKITFKLDNEIVVNQDFLVEIPSNQKRFNKITGNSAYKNDHVEIIVSKDDFSFSDVKIALLTNQTEKFLIPIIKFENDQLILVISVDDLVEDYLAFVYDEVSFFTIFQLKVFINSRSTKSDIVSSIGILATTFTLGLIVILYKKSIF